MEPRDLSLLLALDAMLQEGSVTLAAREDNVYPEFDAKPAMLFCGRDAAESRRWGR